MTRRALLATLLAVPTSFLALGRRPRRPSLVPVDVFNLKTVNGQTVVTRVLTVDEWGEIHMWPTGGGGR